MLPFTETATSPASARLHAIVFVPAEVSKTVPFSASVIALPLIVNPCAEKAIDWTERPFRSFVAVARLDAGNEIEADASPPGDPPIQFDAFENDRPRRRSRHESPPAREGKRIDRTGEGKGTGRGPLEDAVYGQAFGGRLAIAAPDRGRPSSCAKPDRARPPRSPESAPSERRDGPARAPFHRQASDSA